MIANVRPRPRPSVPIRSRVGTRARRGVVVRMGTAG